MARARTSSAGHNKTATLLVTAAAAQIKLNPGTKKDTKYAFDVIEPKNAHASNYGSDSFP